MPTLHKVRHLIETALAALTGEATIAEGISLQCSPRLTIHVESEHDPQSTAEIRFHPPPEIIVRRGPIRLRCSLTGVTVGSDDVRLKIDGWFDRRWTVKS